MISTTKIGVTETSKDKNYVRVEMSGLSTDEKPTQVGDKYIANGSQYIEMDSGKLYLYDLENTRWLDFGGDNPEPTPPTPTLPTLDLRTFEKTEDGWMLVDADATDYWIGIAETYDEGTHYDIYFIDENGNEYESDAVSTIETESDEIIIINDAGNYLLSIYKDANTLTVVEQSA